jgi:hypothetical protein
MKEFMPRSVQWCVPVSECDHNESVTTAHLNPQQDAAPSAQVGADGEEEHHDG